MNTELSLIRFNVINFFNVLMFSRPLYPTSTLLIKIVNSLLSSENESNKKLKERVDWIYENTHKQVMIPLSIVEFVVFTNIQKSQNLNRQVEIDKKEFHLIELYRYLNAIEKELCQIVIQIAKRYSFEIPFSAMMGAGGKQGDNQTISI